MALARRGAEVDVPGPVLVMALVALSLGGVALVVGWSRGTLGPWAAWLGAALAAGAVVAGHLARRKKPDRDLPPPPSGGERVADRVEEAVVAQVTQRREETARALATEDRQERLDRLADL